jgi:hypothetical protein
MDKGSETMSNHKPGKSETHRCKEIGPRLTDYAAGALSAGEVRWLESHLDTCRDCREEYELILRLNEASRHSREKCRAVMASIDWDETARALSSRIPFEPVMTRQPRRSLRSWFHMNWPAITFNWKLAAPAMAGIFLLGIWLGYLLFHITPTAPAPPGSPAEGLTTAAALNRLENTLARKEVAGYFDQSQLVLTDLMKQCKSDGSFSLHDQVDIRRVRDLLSKSRYLRENLDEPRLMSSKKLLEKIEWLLYEILISSSDDETSCKKIEQFQNYIKQERLLFKIRLVGNELSLSEV